MKDPTGGICVDARYIGVESLEILINGMEIDLATNKGNLWASRSTQTNIDAFYVLLQQKKTEQEIQLAVALTIVGEAGGPGSYPDIWPQGQEAVAWTIINRHQNSGNDILSIVTTGAYHGYFNAKARYENGYYESLAWQEAWDYANTLGNLIAIGDYDKIPYPQKWEKNRYTSFYASKDNPNNICGNVFR